VKVRLTNEKGAIVSAVGAALTALCGVALLNMPLGDMWIHASYDYLFRFGSRAITNDVVLIMMDNDAYDYFHQTRGQPWDRELHARLLNKLADDGCALVVMDCFFHQNLASANDEALAKAMRRQRRIALMAEQSEVTSPAIVGLRPVLPVEPFFSAAAGNWGVAWLDPDQDLVVRRHWPFPSPGPYPSLPQTAARLEGALISDFPQERWLRYYGPDGPWTRLSYRFAFTQPTNYFRNRIVCVGTQPKTSRWDGETDEFCTPYTRWTGETSGGAEILLTCFLNLMNGDWLRRASGWMEAAIVVFAGTALGGGLCRMRLLAAFAFGGAAAVIIMLAAVLCSHYANYWFPWLVIAGGQLPCALAWAVAFPGANRSSRSPVGHQKRLREQSPEAELPKIPGYELFLPPIGQGAYGTVWLARNAGGEWRAIKIILLRNFNNDAGPYEREFNGVLRYQPVSDKHPSLLRVDFVSEKFSDHFYYVMELGDSLDARWKLMPSAYRPHDLASECARSQSSSLPAHECLRIGLELAGALDFLHGCGLTHRDIKPRNILFVNGRPKLADLGLIAEIRHPDQTRTAVGTPGYMPPPPELPGTVQADIYALGMVLYVLSTGRSPAYFPEISTTIAENVEVERFFAVNTIVLKACQPDPAQRYASALEMHRALQNAQKAVGPGTSTTG
jgi:CHASE2 domain-containing sensor protein